MDQIQTIAMQNPTLFRRYIFFSRLFEHFVIEKTITYLGKFSIQVQSLGGHDMFILKGTACTLTEDQFVSI